MGQPDKPERLTGAAKQLFYQNGVEQTSLAQIAQAAGVPLGNVYYHFKTKDALLEAVIAAHAADILAQLARFNAETGPKARLRAFVRRGLPYKQTMVQFGCPYATLTAELAKSEGSPAKSATVLFKLYLDWLERQYRELGREDAAELALEALSSLQGAFMLAHATRSAELLERHTAWLEKWVEAT